MDDRLPTELLPALLALLETQSVTLAAKRMHVGQPAMSRTLEKLRAVTEDPLLVREGRNLVPTKRARELLPELREVLAGAARVLTKPASFVASAATGTVTLALGDDMQAVLAGPLLARLRASAPGLDIRVRPLHLDTPSEAVRGAIDVAVLPDVRAQYPALRVDDLVLRKHYMRTFVAVSRRRLKLELARFVAAEHVLVSPQGEEGGYVDDALQALGLRRRVAVTVPSFLAAIALVQGSDLVATLPLDVVRVLAPRLHRQPCPVATPELAMCTGWAARFNHEPRHRWLRTHVSDALNACGRGATR